MRAYQDEDAILLLLRFDPAETENGSLERCSPLLDTAFLAMPGMIASAVEARTGRRLSPGNLSVCADRGLAVFAFSALMISSSRSPTRISSASTPARSAWAAPAGRRFASQADPPVACRRWAQRTASRTFRSGSLNPPGS